MQNPVKNPLYRPLCLLLLLSLLASPVVAMSGGEGQTARAELTAILFLVANSFVAFVWFRRDSDARRYRRSLMRNICFNSFCLLYLPYYLFRTRPGERWMALLRLLGFGGLMILATLAGMAIIGF